MDAGERHGFEGDGFAYLKSPIWWAGISTRTSPDLTIYAWMLMGFNSCPWRDRKLCRLRFRTRNSSNPTRRIECFDRGRTGLDILEGKVRCFGETRMRHMFDRICHNSSTCTSG